MPLTPACVRNAGSSYEHWSVAMSASVRALLISAPASGQGKTTVAAALARLAVRCGHRVRVFKTGPDFIDPMILERAAGQPVYQLDLWMGGLSHCRDLLYQAAREGDLILVEGVMGLYDGDPPSADLAQTFNLPVALVIDGSAMAQTFGAIALGLKNYRPELKFHGVIANRVAGASHASMLSASLIGPAAEIRFLGALPQDATLAIPDRHLGLVQADEIPDLDARLDRAADAIAATLKLAEIPEVPFVAPDPVEPPPRLLTSVRIAVARDAAFSFAYPANLALLEAMGAAVSYFSPLEDETLPAADAIYLPGGYPELHAERLAANREMHQALRSHVEAGKPMLAECGGMMLLFEHLTDVNGRRHAMVGLLPGETAMQSRLQSLALQSVQFEKGELRGHSFHHSRLITPLSPTHCGRTQHGGAGEAVFRVRRLTTTYIHFYWPSNPHVAAQLFLP
jgi:cobyrinic acid a,c-diamide synthase